MTLKLIYDIDQAYMISGTMIRIFTQQRRVSPLKL